MGTVGHSGKQGVPGLPGDRIYTPCCGEIVSYSHAGIGGKGLGWHCDKCEKTYLTLDLVSYQEYKNINRTKLIDKMTR